MGETHFLIYQDHIGEWRWKIIAENGKTIADSGEGYINAADCLAGIDLVKDAGKRDVEVRTAKRPQR